MPAEGAGDRADGGAHAKALVTDPIGDGEVAQAAGAGGRGEGADEPPVNRILDPGKFEEAEERAGPMGEGDESEVDDEQKREDEGEHRPGEVLEHPFDGP